MLKKALITILLIATLSYANTKPILIFYCGSTMVKPITKISKIVEKKHNCTIYIKKGGSKTLYTILKSKKVGDLYLPGSNSYRKKNLEDGFLLDSQYIGFNKAAIFVQKGNPKGIKNLDDLLRKDINTILCNPYSGSIGKMTKKLLTKYKGAAFLEDAYDRAVDIATQSKMINNSLIKKEMDLSINWRATAFWSDNAKYIDIIEIDNSIAPKKKLVINLLSFSKHPNIAKDFMKIAASQTGQEIMRKYGFLE